MREIVDVLLDPTLPLALICWAFCIVAFVFATGCLISMFFFFLEDLSGYKLTRKEEKK